MKRFITTTIVAAAFAAGAAQAAAVKMETDKFDGATRIWVDPYGLNCGMVMTCPMLGVRWTSALKDEAILTVKLLYMYTQIEGVKLNIDGSFIDLKPAEPNKPTDLSNNGYTPGVPVLRMSSREYLIPVELVQVMLAAKNVQVRVYTGDGFIDGAFSGGKRAAKVYGAFQSFWDKLPYHPAPTAPVAKAGG